MEKVTLLQKLLTASVRKQGERESCNEQERYQYNAEGLVKNVFTEFPQTLRYVIGKDA